MAKFKMAPIERSFLKALEYRHPDGLLPLEALNEIRWAEKDKGDSAARFVLDRLVTVGLAKKEEDRYFAA